MRKLKRYKQHQGERERLKAQAWMHLRNLGWHAVNSPLVYLAIVVLVIYALVGCAKAKHVEYKIDGQWQRCEYIRTEACGETLRCGDTIHSCQTNVETRST